jgi:histidinol-phosphate aminotransferase
VVDAIRRELGEDGATLRLYPNPRSTPLRAAVAKLHGLGETKVCIGNGSDDILTMLVRTFCSDKAPLGFTVPSYSLYPVLVAIQDGGAEVIELDRSMRLPVERICASSARAFVLTSPNAPTGVGFGNAELEQVLDGYHGLFVVDEAYAAYARESAVSLLARHRHLVIVRTLSKAYALAGIRVGYALADTAVIDVLDRVRDSYNVSRLSQVAATAAVEDHAHLESLVSRVIATRDAFVADLTRRRNWFTYDSQANFVFTEPVNVRGETGPAVARSAYEYLYAKKVLVRYFPNHELTASFLRVSVGTDAEMAVLRDRLDAWQTI